MMSEFIIYVIDDDQDICDSLKWLFESVQLQVHIFANAQDFLQKHPAPQWGCLIVDVRMPLMSGLELLEHLKSNGILLPVIIITGFADVLMAVRAMKAGAADFLLKPLNHQHLLEIIQKLMQTNGQKPIDKNLLNTFNLLTPRETEVMHLIVDGKSNKEISKFLNIAVSTVEAHRARLMRKLQVRNLADLVKTYLCAYYENHFN